MVSLLSLLFLLQTLWSSFSFLPFTRTQGGQKRVGVVTFAPAVSSRLLAKQPSDADIMKSLEDLVGGEGDDVLGNGVVRGADVEFFDYDTTDKDAAFSRLQELMADEADLSEVEVEPRFRRREEKVKESFRRSYGGVGDEIFRKLRKGGGKKRVGKTEQKEDEIDDDENAMADLFKAGEQISKGLVNENEQKEENENAHGDDSLNSLQKEITTPEEIESQLSPVDRIKQDGIFAASVLNRMHCPSDPDADVYKMKEIGLERENEFKAIGGEMEGFDIGEDVVDEGDNNSIWFLGEKEIPPHYIKTLLSMVKDATSSGLMSDPRSTRALQAEFDVMIKEVRCARENDCIVAKKRTVIRST